MKRARLMLIEHEPDDAAISTAPKPRGRPFLPGNNANPRGRPKGSRHAAQVALDAIGQDNAEELLQTVVDAALGGDMRAAGILLDRLWPVRKGRPVRLELPTITGASDIASAMSVVIAAMAAGDITPEEADAVSSILNTQARVLELRDLELRIKALEDQHGPKP